MLTLLAGDRKALIGFLKCQCNLIPIFLLCSGQPAFSKSEPARETGATPQELQRSPEDSGAGEQGDRL